MIPPARVPLVRLLLAIWLGCVALVHAPGAAGGPQDASAAPTSTVDSKPEADFAAAQEAMARGAYTEAIDRLELLADRGFVHPDASFNRGVAYLARAHGANPVRGDRGRAVASLRETLLLRSGDAEAEALLLRARRELERERARRGSDQHVEAPALSRAVVGLLHENTWAALAVFFSAAMAVGSMLRVVARRRTASAGSLALTGAILAAVGALGLALTGGGTALARSLRRTTEPAVVIVGDARLHDAAGRPLSQPPLPEGAEIHVVETRGSLARIERSSQEAWVRRSDIRVLALPSDLQSSGLQSSGL